MYISAWLLDHLGLMRIPPRRGFLRHLCHANQRPKRSPLPSWLALAQCWSPPRHPRPCSHCASWNTLTFCRCRVASRRMFSVAKYRVEDCDTTSSGEWDGMSWTDAVAMDRHGGSPSQRSGTRLARNETAPSGNANTRDTHYRGRWGSSSQLIVGSLGWAVFVVFLVHMEVMQSCFARLSGVIYLVPSMKQLQSPRGEVRIQRTQEAKWARRKKYELTRNEAINT